jgi:uncharacterized protein (DUF433 family)
MLRDDARSARASGRANAVALGQLLRLMVLQGWLRWRLGRDRCRLHPSRLRAAALQMLDWSKCEAVESHPQRVSGAWVFRGTRVPVSALFQNIESGATVDQFLEWFPGVTRQQVEAVLEHAAQSAQAA